MLAFQQVQQQLSPVCFNNGEPLRALALHHACYLQVVGALNSQMTCSAIRLTAGAYASAKSNGHAIPNRLAFIARGRCSWWASAAETPISALMAPFRFGPPLAASASPIVCPPPFRTLSRRRRKLTA